MVAQHKKAIAMIELIFALVIMGIVLLSAPMLIQQSVRSGNVALQQEAIAAAASQTSIALSMHWDEANSNIPVGESPILRSNRSPFDFNETDVPRGLVGVDGRNSQTTGTLLDATTLADFGKDETNSSDTNESDYTDFDDVDDYHGSQLGLMIFSTSEITTSGIGDYVDVNINMASTINYAEDRTDTGDTTLTGTTINLNNKINSTSIGGVSNIKFITVNLTSNSGVEELEKNISMEAFSCNIGTYVPQDRGEL